jgi:hypothetical protein
MTELARENRIRVLCKCHKFLKIIELKDSKHERSKTQEFQPTSPHNSPLSATSSNRGQCSESQNRMFLTSRASTSKNSEATPPICLRPWLDCSKKAVPPPNGNGLRILPPVKLGALEFKRASAPPEECLLAKRLKGRHYCSFNCTSAFSRTL